MAVARGLDRWDPGPSHLQSSAKHRFFPEPFRRFAAAVVAAVDETRHVFVWQKRTHDFFWPKKKGFFFGKSFKLTRIFLGHFGKTKPGNFLHHLWKKDKNHEES